MIIYVLRPGKRGCEILIKQNSKAISAGEMELYFLEIEDISQDSEKRQRITSQP